jgi:cupin 2 domain-containing protein
MSDGNIFAAVPQRLRDEEFRTLFASEGVRIERIVTTGQTSADWYDQPTGEWVLVLAGVASLRFEDEAQPRTLQPGDYIFIAPHRRHRVTWSDPAQPTIWLAVHFGGDVRLQRP